MGSIISFKCPQCGYEHEFSLGAGMADYYEHGRKWTARSILNGNYGEDVKRALEKNPTARIQRSDELFYCKDCKEYTSESAVELYKLKKFLWVKKWKFLIASTHTCKQCHKEIACIKAAQNIYGKVACPKCQASMERNRVGHWD